jgi:hypothetical protein
MKTILWSLVALGLLSPALQAEPSGVQEGRFVFQNGIVLEYKIVPFDKAAFKKNEGGIGPVFGVDGGGIPAAKLQRLSLRRDKTVTSLEASCMYDPGLGGMHKKRFNVRILNPRSLLLTGIFSDAAATYVAEWLIVDGIGVRTLLTDDPDAVSRFVKPQNH